MVNLSLIATAIPSLGRLIVELQPAVNAFAMTENHGARNSDKYILSFSGRMPKDYTLEHGLGNTSVRRESKLSGHSKKSGTSGTESTRGLREHIVQQAVDFRLY